MRGNLANYEDMWTTRVGDYALVRRQGPRDLRPHYSLRLSSLEVTIKLCCDDEIHEEVIRRMLAAGVRVVEQEPFYLTYFRGAERRCYALGVGAAPPQDDVAGSCLRGVRAALPDEGWPEENGAAVMPLCQINLTGVQLSYHQWPQPPEQRLDLISVFVSPALRVGEAMLNGEGWQLRQYSDVSRLVPLETPARWKELQPAPIIMAPMPDFPHSRQIPPELVLDAAAAGCGDRYRHLTVSKVGGWSTPAFGSAFGNKRQSIKHFFQLEAPDGMDALSERGGMIFIGYGSEKRRRGWFLEWKSAGAPGDLRHQICPDAL